MGVELDQNIMVTNDWFPKDKQLLSWLKKKTLTINIQKGDLIIDGVNDSIRFEMESLYMFSEPEKIVELGDVKGLTEKKGKNYLVKLVIEYNQSLYNVTWQNSDNEKVFKPSSISHKIAVENKGRNSLDGKLNINFLT